jgi:nitroreductase
MDYTEFMELVKARRSVRGFKPDPVPNEMIHQIVEAAKLAPTGNNTQPFEVVAVKEATLIDGIESAMAEGFIPTLNQRFNAPVMLLVLGDPRFYKAYPQGAENAIFRQSLSLAIGNMLLAITSLGLGSVWKCVPPLAQVRIKDLLSIPQVFALEVVLPLGFPKKEEAEARPKRDIPIHFDRYDEKGFMSDEKISEAMKTYCRVKELGIFRAL